MPNPQLGAAHRNGAMQLGSFRNNSSPWTETTYGDGGNGYGAKKSGREGSLPAFPEAYGEAIPLNAVHPDEDEDDQHYQQPHHGGYRGSSSYEPSLVSGVGAGYGRRQGGGVPISLASAPSMAGTRSDSYNRQNPTSPTIQPFTGMSPPRADGQRLASPPPQPISSSNHYSQYPDYNAHAPSNLPPSTGGYNDFHQAQHQGLNPGPSTSFAALPTPYHDNRPPVGQQHPSEKSQSSYYQTPNASTHYVQNPSPPPSHAPTYETNLPYPQQHSAQAWDAGYGEPDYGEQAQQGYQQHQHQGGAEVEQGTIIRRRGRGSSIGTERNEHDPTESALDTIFV